MILAPNLVDYLKKALKTAQVFKCESMVIEKNMFRTMNTERSLVIADTDVPEGIPFEGMGIHDVSKLSTRMNLLDNYTVDLDLDGSGMFVMAVHAKSKGTSIKYRCANPKTIKTPRTVNETYQWNIQFQPDAIAQLTKAAAAMGAIYITINCVDGECSFFIQDDNRNDYKQEFVGNVEYIHDMDEEDDKPINFAVTYQKDVFLTALKYAEEVDLPPEVEGEPKRKGKTVQAAVGINGSLKVVVNSITAFLAPMSLL